MFSFHPCCTTHSQDRAHPSTSQPPCNITEHIQAQPSDSLQYIADTILTTNYHSPIFSLFGLDIPPQMENTDLLIALYDCLEYIRPRLPRSIHTAFPENRDLIFQKDLLISFLENAYDYNLVSSVSRVYTSSDITKTAQKIRTAITQKTFPQTEELDCHNKKLVCLPIELCSIPGIKIINAEKNYIRAVSTLFHEKSLLFIKLADNPIPHDWIMTPL